MDILKSIDDFKLGYTHVVNGNGELKGIISNADIRKGILKSGGSPEKLGVKDLLNPNPVKVVEDASIPEMLRLVRNTQFNVLYLPVVDKNNRLTGAVSFTNLIKGE
jgi:ribulose-phosphate 3-epimerase